MHHNLNTSRLINGHLIPQAVYDAALSHLKKGDILLAIRAIYRTIRNLREAQVLVASIALEQGLSGFDLPEYKIVSDFHAINGLGNNISVIESDEIEDGAFRKRCNYYISNGLIVKNSERYVLTAQGRNLIHKKFEESTNTKHIVFSTCFLSHSTRDRPFVEYLYQRLHASGLKVWYAPHDLSPGDHLDKQLEDAIRVNDRVLLVLSRNSIRSTWVQRQILTARRRERQENRKILFPVSLVSHKTIREWVCTDPDTGEDLALEIRRFFIPQFDKWKSVDQFYPIFERLIGALAISPTECNRGQ